MPEENPSRTPAESTTEQRVSRIPAWIWLSGAVLVLLSILTGLQTRRLQAELSGLNDQLRGQRIRGLALDAERQHHETILAILSSPTTREFVLAPSDASATGRRPIRAFWNQEKGLLLLGDRLPQPAVGRVFRLWVTPKSGTSVDCGAFRPDRQGKTNFLTTSKVGPGEAQALWITEEPEPGSAQPVSTPMWKARIR